MKNLIEQREYSEKLSAYKDKDITKVREKYQTPKQKNGNLNR